MTLKPMPKDMVFSLDIGTRNVVGMLTKQVEERFEILHYEMMEHPDRAMFDGQIHDIEKVAKVVSKVVSKIEEKSGFKLEQAAIAAAGRALKTSAVTLTQEIDYTKDIDKSMLDAIEMEAIQEAQKKLLDDGLITKYYCVGYSVINYFLDDSMILNPKGHRGSKVKVEVIATFLPQIVVDSLYSVVNMVGLEVMNLTLEPIAAINVAIPTNLRLLNLVLVDVGAGTSDIAISKDGTVTSYGMVSVAGDELTEKLAQKYLIDFNSAEKLKIELCSQDMHTFTDIVGIPHEESTASIMSHLNDTLDKITAEIADQILLLNGKAPSAVFCIGGGCQIPSFTEKLSLALDLPVERTVIKGTEALASVEFIDEPLEGPEYITPIGIAYTAYQDKESDFLHVTVNDQSVRLFNSKKLTVSDALVLVGFNPRHLLPSRGPSIKVTLDGKIKKILGDYGEPAKIFVNGVVASLDTKINNKDNLYVEEAIPGKERVSRLDEFIDMNQHVLLKETRIPLVEFIKVNGEYKGGDYKIQAEDDFVTEGIKTVSDLADKYELDLSAIDFKVQDVSVLGDYILKPGDQLDYSKRTVERPLSVETVDYVMESSAEVPRKESSEIEERTFTYRITVNGEGVSITSGKPDLMFVDIFDHIDFDLSSPQGILLLTLNGKRARYTDFVKSGDVIGLSWRS